MNFISAFLLVLCSSLSWGQQPGFQVQVNSRGIDLVRSVATKTLERQIRSVRITDQSLDSKTSISQVRLNYFNIGATKAITSSPNRFSLSATGMHLSVTARVRHRLKILFFTTIIHETATARAGHASLQVNFQLGRDGRTERPTLFVQNCRAALGNFNIKFSGSFLATIINWFVGLFRDKVRRQFESQTCSKIIEYTRKFNQDNLKNFEVFPIFDGFKLNLAQVRNPLVTSSGVTVFFNGQFFSKKLNTPPSSPFQAPAVPTLPSTSRMAQILISEYVLDTLLYSIWKEGKLNQTVSSTQIDRIGQFWGIPLINETERFEIKLSAARSPKADISSTGIEITTPFIGYLNNGLANESLQFTINLFVQASLNITNNGIEIKSKNVTIASAGGDDEIASDVQTLLAIVQETNLINDQFLAVRNAALSGFQPFEKFNYFFRNPTVQHENGVIVLGSDFIFNPVH